MQLVKKNIKQILRSEKRLFLIQSVFSFYARIICIRISRHWLTENKNIQIIFRSAPYFVFKYRSSNTFSLKFKISFLKFIIFNIKFLLNFHAKCDDIFKKNKFVIAVRAYIANSFIRTSIIDLRIFKSF